MIDQEFEDDPQVEAAKFLLNPEEDRAVDPETQARLEQLLQAAGTCKLGLDWNPYYLLMNAVIELYCNNDTYFFYFKA